MAMAICGGAAGIFGKPQVLLLEQPDSLGGIFIEEPQFSSEIREFVDTPNRSSVDENASLALIHPVSPPFASK